LKKGGTLGYVQGELMTSRAAFFTAYRKYKAENPNFDPKKFTEEDLSLITKRAEEYRLNMSKANESVLQRNLLLKVPFQFWQITHKFMTKVLPQRIPGTKISLGGTDEFTPGEKARLFFGTLIGFGGTHTLPAGEQITNYALEAFGVDAKDLTENEATLLRSGVVGILLKIGLGIGSDITTRVSLGTDFFKQFTEAFIDAELPKALLGAGSGVYERAHNGVVLTGTALAMFARDEEKLTSTDLVYLSGVALHSVLNLFSSTASAKRYWANVFENSQDFKNTKNEFVMRSAGINDQTAWAAFLGIAPKELTEMYEEKFRYDETDRPRGLRLDTDIKVVTQLLYQMQQMPPGDERAKTYAKLTRQIVRSYPDAYRNDLFEKVFEKINEPTENIDQILRDNYDKCYEGMDAGLDFCLKISPTMSKAFDEGKLER
jgi:hypothetical protein